MVNRLIAQLRSRIRRIADTRAVSLAAVSLVIGSIAVLSAPGTSTARIGSEFPHWLVALEKEARNRGISQATLDSAFEGVQLDAKILDRDRSQPGAPQKFCDYMDRRLTETRIDRGKRMLVEHRALLSRVSAEYGVPPRIIVSLWGLESNFGDYQGSHRVIDALATLAFDPRRGEMFRSQLLAALQILEDGHKTTIHLEGSWAGAMGQVQFMPTTFLRYAVDFDGDGRKDIWESVPDALASAANYLSVSGWRAGETWGREVQVPKALAGNPSRRSSSRSLQDWQRDGVRNVDGRDLPVANMRGSVVFPTHEPTTAFLVYPNYDTILNWNRSTFFAVSVGALADQLTNTATMRACRI